jgi:asparagine synthase (glutamine-hydrolysing)
MCGIAGVFFYKPQEIPRPPLQRMADALIHRGPDEEGFYYGKGAALAHRRLKIIDLSQKASQPMHDEASRYFIIYNGEIYNFTELRKELESKYDFFSHSDTEVILRLFQESRERSWLALNGMFAVAIYDSKQHELYLARDHAGIKPLYYYHDTEKLLFASELKALFASGWIEPEYDEQSFAGYLQLGYFTGGATPYRSIRKLLPGNFAKVNAGGLRIEPYWDIQKFYSNPKTNSRSAEAASRLGELLMTSVRHQMISDVPLGAFLSGGIDSSLLVALMSKISDQPVKTFTVGFQSMGYYDERPHAKRIAELFKTEHHEFVVDESVDQILNDVVSHFDEPLADSSALPTFCLARLARKHVTVALSGTGADEIFGGYRKYMAANWIRAYSALPGAVRSSIQKAAALLPSSRKSLWQERALLLQRFMDLDLNRGPAFNSIFTRDEIEQLIPVSGTAPVPQGPQGSETIAEYLLLFDYMNYLPEDLLVKEDRCTMAWGLEARVPYLDREVVEYMASLPVHLKVSAASTKKLFKIVARKHLPGWVLKRPKHGFGSPAAEWLRGELLLIAEVILFGSKSLLALSPLIREKFSQHLRGEADNSRQIWAVLMLEMWDQNNKKEVKKVRG